MSVDVFDLKGVIRLDTSDYEKGLKKASSDSQSFGAKVKSGFGKAAKIGGAALAGATAVAGKFAKDAIQDSISYESAFTGVMKTVDETATTTYEDISKAIKQMATETASSQEDIAGVAEVAGQLGVSADDITGFTKTIVELGDTTNLSAEEAASALAKFSNITGDGSENIDRIGSSIVDLGNHFATTEADIVNMSSRLASSATIAGLTSTDILGLSTAISSVGVQAEAGGTAMSSIIKKMGSAVDEGLDPGNKKLKLFAKTAGMSAQEFSQAWNTNPIQAIKAFTKGLGEFNEAGGNVTGLLDNLKIKGIRESNTIQALALASDKMTDAVSMANTAWMENSALTNEAEKRYGTTESKINQMQAAMKNMKLALVDGLGPAFQSATSQGIDSIKELTSAFESGGFDGFMTKLGDVATKTIGALVERLPKAVDAGSKLLMSVIKGITKSIPQLAKAAVEVVKGLVDAISQAVPDVLQAGVDLIVEFGNGISDAIPQILPKMVDLVMQLAENLLNNAPKIVKTGLNLLVSLGKGIIQAIPKIVKAIPKLITALLNAILDAIPQIINAGVELFSALIDDLPDIITNIVTAIPEIIMGIVDALMNNIDKIVDAGVNLLVALVTNLPAIIAGIVKAIPKIILGIVEALLKGIPKIIATGVKLAGSIIKGILNFVVEIPGKLAKFIRGIIDYFASGQVIEDLLEAGKGIVTAIWDGLKAAWDAVVKWFEGAINWIIDKWKKVKNFIKDLFESEGVKEIVEKVNKDKGYTQNEYGEWEKPGMNTQTDPRYQAKGAARAIQGVRDADTKELQTQTNVIQSNDKVINAIEDLGKKIEKNGDVVIQADSREVARLVKRYA